MRFILLLIVSAFYFTAQVTQASSYIEAFEEGSKGVFYVYGLECSGKLTLFDYHEYFELNPQDKRIDKASNFSSSLNKKLKIFSHTSHTRSKLYNAWKNKYLNESSIKYQKLADNIDDNFSIVDWDGCQMRTVAKVFNPSTIKMPIRIDQEKFERLSGSDQAGVFFNILINLEVIFLNKGEHTQFSRYLNALTSSQSYFERKKETNYHIEIHEFLSFEDFFYKGVFFNTESIAYSSFGIHVANMQKEPRVYKDLEIDSSYSFKYLKGLKTTIAINDFGIHYFDAINADPKANVKLRLIYTKSGCIGQYRLSPHFKFSAEAIYSFDEKNAQYIFELKKIYFSKKVRFNSKLYSGMNIKKGKVELIQAPRSLDYDSNALGKCHEF